MILTILILLEFNHSIYVALTQRLGAIQVRTVVLITILVIARKLMLRDFETLDVQTLLGFGGLLLALGGLYWLISRRRSAERSRGCARAAGRGGAPLLIATPHVGTGATRFVYPTGVNNKAMLHAEVLGQLQALPLVV